MPDVTPTGRLKRRPKPKPATRFVALCDVLGFSDLVKNTPITEIGQRYKKLVGDARVVSRQYIQNPDEAADFRRHPLKYAVFSDTILVWSEPIIIDGDRPYHIGLIMARFFDSLQSLMKDSLFDGLPLRIGVAFGESIISRSAELFVGKAIVDAYETEQRQEWIGIALHSSCLDAAAHIEERAQNEGGDNGEQTDDLLPYTFIEYPIPTKSVPTGPPLEVSLPWPMVVGLDAILEEGVARLKGTPPEAKWANALAFSKYCQSVLGPDQMATILKLGPGGYGAVAIISDGESVPILPLPDDEHEAAQLVRNYWKEKPSSPPSNEE